MCFLLANLAGNGVLRNGLISVASADLLYFVGSLLLFIVSLFGEAKEKAENVCNNVKINQLIKRTNKEKCDIINENDIVKLFVLSAKEIMIGEKVMNVQGVMTRKKADIKNLVNRCAAELGIDIIFGLNRSTGEVYKILKYDFEESKTYFNIGYNELNRCLEMNEASRAKYKKITDENWRNVTCQG